jgi:hypothetical protein
MAAWTKRPSAVMPSMDGWRDDGMDEMPVRLDDGLGGMASQSRARSRLGHTVYPESGEADQMHGRLHLVGYLLPLQYIMPNLDNLAFMA